MQCKVRNTLYCRSVLKDCLFFLAERLDYILDDSNYMHLEDIPIARTERPAPVDNTKYSVERVERKGNAVVLTIGKAEEPTPQKPEEPKPKKQKKPAKPITTTTTTTPATNTATPADGVRH